MFPLGLFLDVDVAMRLKLKVLVNVQTGRSRDLDTVRHAMRFHTTGDVHGIAPNVVHEFVGPDDPRHHVARVHPEAHLQRDRQVVIRPLDSLEHRQRRISDRVRIVRARLGHAAGQHVGVSNRLDFFDPKTERQLVKLRKQSVQKPNHVSGRQLGRKCGETD